MSQASSRDQRVNAVNPQFKYRDRPSVICGADEYAKLDGVAEYSIAAGGYSAVIVGQGAGLRQVRHDGRLLTEAPAVSDADKPPLSCGLVLAPWPNRTADGAFTFDGHSYQLDITEPDRNNANHGFVRTIEWNLHDVGESSVTLGTSIGQHPGWPFDLTIAVEYSLDAAAGLTATVTVANVGGERAPFALGHHTFLRVADVPLDDCTLTFPAAAYLPVDSRRQLPAGDPLPVADTDRDFRAARAMAGEWLDTPFTKLEVAASGRHETVLRAPDGTGSMLWTDTSFGWSQLFTADPTHDQGFPGRGRALAVEPMTAPPNALASGIDLITLEPGQQWSGSWGISAVPSGVIKQL